MMLQLLFFSLSSLALAGSDKIFLQPNKNIQYQTMIFFSELDINVSIMCTLILCRQLNLRHLLYKTKR